MAKKSAGRPRGQAEPEVAEFRRQYEDPLEALRHSFVDLLHRFRDACLLEDVGADMPWTKSPGRPFKTMLEQEAKDKHSLDPSWHQLVAARCLAGSDTEASGRSCCSLLVQLFAGPRWLLRCRACEVVVHGGAANGFGTRDSDLDVMLIPWGSLSEVSPAEARGLLEAACSMLKEQPVFGQVGFVDRAHVETLRCRFQGELMVDVSVFSQPDVARCQFLSCWAQIPINASLCAAVKAWAKAAGILGGRRLGLSSYAFVILGLYFLHLQSKDMTCAGTLAELMRGFFVFYSGEFSWDHEVVSLRFPDRRRVFNYAPDAVQFCPIAGRASSGPLYIEDPAQCACNVADGLTPSAREELRHALAATAASLRAMVFPDCLLLQMQEWGVPEPCIAPLSGPGPPPAG